MPETQVAIIYDDTARPETTGTYCRRALESLARVEHFLPADAGRIPGEGFDLYLVIDDGLRFDLPAELRPAAWWAIDTHMDLGWYLDRGPQFDHVFVAQRPDVARLSDHGSLSSWLPLACDPAVHRRHDVTKTLDVCFVGNVNSSQRRDLAAMLQRHFPSHFIGRRYFDEMAQTYSTSRMIFNRSIRDDLNMRVFEALACGSLLLTNALPPESGQGELFQDGTHLATYGSAEEMLDKARFYLGNDPARERIAAAGRERVLAAHTYLHRMQTVLETMRKHSGRGATALSPTPSPKDAVKRVSDQGVGKPEPQGPPTMPPPPEGRMRVLYLGVFANPWSIEQAVAEAMRRRGHTVDCVDEEAVESTDALVKKLGEGGYDCLLFSKGRIGRKAVRDKLFTTGEDIADVIGRCGVPCYTWYFGRALGYEPSREQWMRRVAPLCRVAFVVDGSLTQTNWANWHWLQQGMRPGDLPGEPPPFGRRRHAVGFIGSIYGERAAELAAARQASGIHVISDAFGPARHNALHECEIILGPRFPAVPGYWPDRLYLVLGHGAFFLAPEIDGMRDEGFEPGVHFAPLGNDPTADIRHWLARPEERARIARAGQELVLRRFTYDHRVEELCRTMAATLKEGAGHRPHRFKTREIPAVDVDRSPASRPRDVASADGAAAGHGADHVRFTNSSQDRSYFEWPRPDLLEMIPREARRILDIGCGVGKLGEAIKQRQAAHVTGIELNAVAAGLARARLDEVHAGNVETLDLSFEPRGFDAIICGDVLEHLRNPEALLRRATEWLADGGCLIASIPNVRHHSVVRSLLEGNWTYESAGLLDETHVRFFGRRDIAELFQENGYEAALVGTSPFPDFEQARKSGFSNLGLNGFSATGLPPEEVAEFFVYQYLVRALPMSRPIQLEGAEQEGGDAS